MLWYIYVDQECGIFLPCQKTKVHYRIKYKNIFLIKHLIGEDKFPWDKCFKKFLKVDRNLMELRETKCLHFSGLTLTKIWVHIFLLVEKDFHIFLFLVSKFYFYFEPALFVCPVDQCRGSLLPHSTVLNIKQISKRRKCRNISKTVIHTYVHT